MKKNLTLIANTVKTSGILFAALVLFILFQREKKTPVIAEPSSPVEKIFPVQEPTVAPTPVVLPTPTPIPVPGPEHFARVDSQLQRTQKHLDRVLAQYESDLRFEYRAPRQEREMKAVASRAGERAGDKLVSLVGKMASDKVKKENKAKEKLNQIISKQTTPWVNGLRDISNRTLNNLGRNMDAQVQDMAYQLATVSPTSGPGFELYPLLQIQDAELNVVMRNLGIQTSITTAFGVMDMVALVRSNMFKILVGKIRGILARQFGGQIAKLAVGGGAAILDGPLPVGDVILGGAVAWTLYDIKKGKDDFEEDVEKVTLTVLRKTREDLFTKSLRKAREKHRESTKSIEKIAQHARKKLRALQMNPKASAVISHP